MCEDFEGVNGKCKMFEMRRKVEVLYRTSKYGKWQFASIVIPEGCENVRQMVIDDLTNCGFKNVEVQIKKITK